MPILWRMDTLTLADAASAHTTLSSLVNLLASEGLLLRTYNLSPEAANAAVTGVDCDSRVAAPGHVFVCKGRAFKPAYLSSAAERGAIAYLCDEALAPALREACPQLPALVAGDLRRAMAIASAEGWGHPDRHIRVLGVTGTKGKSTVTYMLRSILDAVETCH